MDYEKGIFKRYERKRGSKKVTQVGVSGLSVNSKFKDNEEIYILSKDELNQLESTNTEIIQDLKNQIKEAELKIKSLENTTPENLKYINRVIDLQEEINNRNQLLFNTQNTINNIFQEVNKATNTTEKNILSFLSDFQKDINTILEFSKELNKQVTSINSNIDNTSWIKWAISKNKFKIVLEMDKLEELEAKLIELSNTDIVQIANSVTTPVEIKENLDLKELYIYINNDNSNKEIIINNSNK